MGLPQYSTALSVKEVFVSFSLSILDTTATQALNIVTIFREMDQEQPLFGSRGMKAAVVQRVQEVRNASAFGRNFANLLYTVFLSVKFCKRRRRNIRSLV